MDKTRAHRRLWHEARRGKRVCLQNTASLAGARIFVTLFPCNECAKLIIQSGLSEVIFYEDKNIKHDAKVTVAT